MGSNNVGEGGGLVARWDAAAVEQGALDEVDAREKGALLQAVGVDPDDAELGAAGVVVRSAVNAVRNAHPSAGPDTSAYADPQALARANLDVARELAATVILRAGLMSAEDAAQLIAEITADSPHIGSIVRVIQSAGPASRHRLAGLISGFDASLAMRVGAELNPR